MVHIEYTFPLESCSSKDVEINQNTSITHLIIIIIIIIIIVQYHQYLVWC
jgi:hypothetical protein